VSGRAATLVREAEAAWAEGREHHRLAARHRREARRRMARVAALRAELAELGIRLTFPGEAPQGGRHGRRAAPTSD
jgi:hypothetical protein